VRRLIEKGAALNSTDNDGWTLLSWASQSRHEAVAKLLIENGGRANSMDEDRLCLPVSPIRTLDCGDVGLIGQQGISELVSSNVSRSIQRLK